jgi:hypothetical protein
MHAYRPAVGTEQSGTDAQQGALATPVGAHDGGDLAGPYRQIHIGEHGPAPVPLADPPHVKADRPGPRAVRALLDAADALGNGRRIRLRRAENQQRRLPAVAQVGRCLGDHLRGRLWADPAAAELPGESGQPCLLVHLALTSRPAASSACSVGSR